MNTPSINILPLSSYEITIDSVSSLIGYLMYYVRKQIETNTNNVILSYMVLVVVIICVIKSLVDLVTVSFNFPRIKSTVNASG